MTISFDEKFLPTDPDDWVLKTEKRRTDLNIGNKVVEEPISIEFCYFVSAKENFFVCEY